MKKLKYAPIIASLLVSIPEVFASDIKPLAKDDLNCSKIHDSIIQGLVGSSAGILEKVEKYVSANPECACEIVKAAIISSEANHNLVTEIVKTAALAAPDQFRLISQCAIAVAPDALTQIQKVVSEYDNQSEVVFTGFSSAKGDYIVGAKGGDPKGDATPLALIDGPDGSIDIESLSLGLDGESGSDAGGGAGSSASDIIESVDSGADGSGSGTGAGTDGSGSGTGAGTDGSGLGAGTGTDGSGSDIDGVLSVGSEDLLPTGGVPIFPTFVVDPLVTCPTGG